MIAGTQNVCVPGELLANTERQYDHPTTRAVLHAQPDNLQLHDRLTQAERCKQGAQPAFTCPLNHQLLVLFQQGIDIGQFHVKPGRVCDRCFPAKKFGIAQFHAAILARIGSGSRFARAIAAIGNGLTLLPTNRTCLYLGNTRPS